MREGFRMNNKMDMKYLANPYNLSTSVIEKIKDIMNDYIDKLEKIEIDSLSLREKLSYLGVITELYPIISDKESYLNICHHLLIQLRNSIYESEYYGISLYDGLSNLALFVKSLTMYTGFYKKFGLSLNSLISKNANIMAQKLCQEKDKTSFLYYDTICGLAGVGNYLLDDYSNKEIKKTLISIAEYFVFLSNTVEIDGEFYPGWIEMDNKMSELEGGYIDFSIAHGIAGPLYFLVKLAKKKIIIPGQMDAIFRIIREYKYVSNRTGYNIWSGKIPKQIYFNDQINVVYRRESWCYGNASVAMILLETAEFIGDDLLYKIVMKTVREISQKDINTLGLETPILCHGYSGTTTIFRRLYDKYKSKEFLLQAIKLLKKTVDSYLKDSKFGFPYYEYTVFNGINEKRSADSLDFLEGSAGIVMEMAGWLKKDSYFEKMMLIK